VTTELGGLRLPEVVRLKAKDRAVQKVLGHKSLTTTQRYTHLTIDDLKEEMERAGL